MNGSLAPRHKRNRDLCERRRDDLMRKLDREGMAWANRLGLTMDEARELQHLITLVGPATAESVRGGHKPPVARSRYQLEWLDKGATMQIRPEDHGIDKRALACRLWAAASRYYRATGRRIIVNAKSDQIELRRVA